MRTMRLAAAVVGSYLIKWFLILFVKYHRGKQIRLGKCEFLGDGEFVNLMSETLEHIKHSDSSLFSRLTEAGSYTFFGPTAFLCTLPQRGIYIINDNYVRWGREGVLTLLTYAANFSEISRGIGFRPVALKELLEARRKTAERLRQIGIDDLLVEMFVDSERPEMAVQ